LNTVVRGTGQVGASVARHLAEEHHDVTIMDISPALEAARAVRRRVGTPGGSGRLNRCLRRRWAISEPALRHTMALYSLYDPALSSGIKGTILC
jgi:glycine/D-amino acid oxidase-like deaminating enzyme